MATYTAGSIFTAASANLLSGVQVKMKTTANSLPSNTTTLTNDGELILPVLAASKYALIGSLIYDCSTTADFKVFFTTPSGSTLSWSTYGLDGGVNTGLSAGNINVGSVVGNPGVTAGAGVNNSVQCFVNGSIVTSGSAGNVQLQFCQNASDASVLTLHAGSWFALLLSQ